MEKAQVYVSVRQAAARLAVHPSSIRRWIMAGIINAVSAGPHLVRIPESEIENFVRPLSERRPRSPRREVVSGSGGDADRGGGRG